MRGIKFLLKEEELGFFPSWERIFGRMSHLYFEIGVGNGEFIVEMAEKIKEANFVGVEVSKEVLRKALSRVEEHALSNVRLIHMEGTKALAKLFKTESLEGVFLNFPDPWPKKKHRKKRIVNQGFLYLLSNRLRINGFFQMATDHSEYAEETVELLKGIESFSPLWKEYLITERVDFFPTKYARKWLSQGKRIYFIGVKKVKKIDLPEWVKEWCPLLKIREEEIALPIVNIFKGRPKLIFSELIKALKRSILYKSENHFIKILDTFYNEEALLLDLLVEEGIIKQRFFVKISPYGKEDYILTPYESGKPDPTEGVHLAMVLLLKKLKEAFQEFELKKSTCKEKFLRYL
ncbi:MAG: tRNA (guanosine(46)-N7)-methyltransferase TrmB [Caldimicrobium sp.]